MINPFNRSGKQKSETPESFAIEASHWQGDWQLISCTLAVALLLTAAASTLDDHDFDFHEGYYTFDAFFKFVHLYVTGLALVLALTFWKAGRALWLVAAAVVVILFNPFIPIDEGYWATYYFITAAGLAIVALTGPSIKAAWAKRAQSKIERTSDYAFDTEPAEGLAPQSQSLNKKGVDEANAVVFNGKELRKNLIWLATVATILEYFLRSVLFGGEDRGTNVLVFIAIGVMSWLIGRLVRRETPAEWIALVLSLAFLVVSLLRYAN